MQGAEVAGERQAQQETEQHLHAERSHPPFLQQIGEVTVVPLIPRLARPSRGTHLPPATPAHRDETRRNCSDGARRAGRAVTEDGADSAYYALPVPVPLLVVMVLTAYATRMVPSAMRSAFTLPSLRIRFSRLPRYSSYAARGMRLVTRHVPGSEVSYLPCLSDPPCLPGTYGDAQWLRPACWRFEEIVHGRAGHVAWPVFSLTVPSRQAGGGDERCSCLQGSENYLARGR